MIRKIFVNLGETIQIHVIRDPDKPKTIRSFNDQHRPPTVMHLKIHSHDLITLPQGLNITVGLESINGDITPLNPG